jgi:hypothetical protein
VMDKEYDSEAIHRQIQEDRNADSIIPIRSRNAEYVGGIYRQEMARQFDVVRYGQRQFVETMFSVLKRKFSGDLKARIFAIQRKEISGKMIVGNIHRFLHFLVIGVFYRAKIFLILEIQMEERGTDYAFTHQLTNFIYSTNRDLKSIGNSELKWQFTNRSFSHYT